MGIAAKVTYPYSKIAQALLVCKQAAGEIRKSLAFTASIAT